MTNAGDGEITSQGITKVKRSMKKCDACRSRKIACNPRDRVWSENVKEKCNSCDNLDLSCGPSLRMNAKVESAPRKLASKDAPDVAVTAATASAGPGAALANGITEINVYRNNGIGLQEAGPSEQQVHSVRQAQKRGRAAIDQAPIWENQNTDVEMAPDTDSPRNYRIFGAANTSQTTYDTMAVSKFGFGGDAALGHPSSTAANAAQYPPSIRSRSTRLDDFVSRPEGPVPIDLRSRTDFVSLGSATFSVDARNTLHQPQSPNLDPRFIDLEHPRPPDLHMTENYPSSACALLPLQSDHFRLLEILPGHQSAPLVTRLIEANVESIYEALSCVADDTLLEFEIINIYTGTTVTAATISLNLAHALRALRSPDSPRKIWIDALCVNQTDTTEKSAQIARMGEILRNAQNLCVWLGTASRDSDLAFKLIALCTGLGKFEALSLNVASLSYWEALIQLMKRSWFRRRWSIFEICFARSAILYCGYQRTGWEEFERAVFFVNTRHQRLRNTSQSENARLLDSLHDVSQLDANRLIQLADMTVCKSTSGDVLHLTHYLEVLVFNCAWTDCRDPRDTIYALLGLSRRLSLSPRGEGAALVAGHEASAANHDPGIHVMESAIESNAIRQQDRTIRTSKLSLFDTIKIDYAKSIFEVSRDFSLHTVDHSRSLDFICRPWAPQGHELPSWMPTVSSNSYVIGKDGFYKRAAADPLIGNPGLNGFTAYNAAQKTEPIYQYDAAMNPRELKLWGFVCGEVLAKKPPANAGIIPWSWFDDNDFLNRARDAKKSFCRTIVANRGPASPYRIPAYYLSVWDYITEQRATGSKLDTTEFRLAERQDSVADEFLARVQATVWDRRLLLARVGDVQLLALGPEHVKKRDLICILHGCSVPVLLRKLDPMENTSNGVQYRLIGECYVDGIMNGEAFDMGGKKMEYFALV